MTTNHSQPETEDNPRKDPGNFDTGCFYLLVTAIYLYIWYLLLDACFK